MRPPTLTVTLLLLGACGGGGDSDGVDAAPFNECSDEVWFEAIEASCDTIDNDCDGTVDNVDEPPTWYTDADGDGHGYAPSPTMESCTQPAGYVGSNDDCDDTTAFRHVGLPETCDGLDNDCVLSTRDDCPANCQPRTRVDDGRHYLFCNNLITVAAARTACSDDSYSLARVDDATENSWIRTTANGIGITTATWLGSTDETTEGAWLWSDGLQFWMGAANGAVTAGGYAAWGSGEPNNSNNEDCGQLRPDGLWNDIPCTGTNRVVCERY